MLSKVVPFTGKRRPPNAGKGRTRGVPNKVTALLKDLILVAAKEAGGKDGFVGYLKLQAIKNPQALLSLLGRGLPLQVSATLAAPTLRESPATRATALALRTGTGPATPAAGEAPIQSQTGTRRSAIRRT